MFLLVGLLLMVGMRQPVIATPLLETVTPTAVPTVTANQQWKPTFKIFDEVEMALVPPGCFMMGSTEAQIADLIKQTGQSFFEIETPQTQICFSMAFWIDKTEVTQAQ